MRLKNEYGRFMMSKEVYEKAVMEVVELSEEVITVSIANESHSGGSNCNDLGGGVMPVCPADGGGVAPICPVDTVNVEPVNPVNPANESSGGIAKP